MMGARLRARGAAKELILSDSFGVVTLDLLPGRSHNFHANVVPAAGISTHSSACAAAEGEGGGRKATTGRSPRKAGDGSALLTSMLAIGLGGAGYVYYTTQVNPEGNWPKIPFSLPSGIFPAATPGSQAPLAPADAPPAVLDLPAVVALSPKEELLQTRSKLEEELNELRKLKRNKEVDAKKRAIKDEIKAIDSGIKAIESKK
eukprot:TRINITY_DN2870_c1_g1_i3.p1 TRINITY_DN2870_c1_g1~~TRINITY_DN2870_c1_g1_i3.p1  ORF type:complete len:203 (+),score=60.25 TRINITY_DN2870_c1_g1_i3:242-850(+)